ncbi:AAA family ATPase [Ignatzschineria cameli]|uniref:AAA family ATPase n=1 Tax=Ignatzschineria cameli TaxID=2182793 RepID=UPI000D612961|nr:ATP-binding protein [Ignatzschineria cameli]PWD85916.1 ATPase [Ignatzschineria cameli]
MISSTNLKALLHSFIDKDQDRFLSLILQIAAREAKKGNRRIASELRDLVDYARSPRVENISQVILDDNSVNLHDLFLIRYPRLKLGNLVVDEQLKHQIKKILTEHRHLSSLKAHGLSPRRKILLAGPPGTGKTLTASILAGELSLPLFQVRMESIITKYLGESSVRLGQVFKVIENFKAVYFFDEFDALGTHRSSSNDVGEARRILNSFLQMIELDTSSNLIICATNHVEFLDYALFRRFDDVLIFTLPDDKERIRVIKNKLAPYEVDDFSWEKIAIKTEGFNNSDLVKASEDAIKNMILEDRKSITLESLIKSIEHRSQINSQINSAALE